MAHARFSPSGAHRWMVCPASIAVTLDAPRTSSAYADEGTAAHTLAARALTYKRDAAFFLGEEIQVDQRVFKVDEEMAGNVQTYLDFVRAQEAGGTLLFEQEVEFSKAIGVDGQFGTADAIILSNDGKTVTVCDLKYGRGVQVNAEENEQMLSYAVGVLETFDLIMSDVERVVLVVCQPRLNHLDMWECSVDRVHEHARQMAEGATLVQRAIDELQDTGVVSDGFFGPREKACTFCAYKPHCPALQREISATVFGDFAALDDPAGLEVRAKPEVPSTSRIGALFGSLELIEDWCRAIRAETERMVMAGLEVIGPDGARMKVVEGKKGHRAWIDKQAAEGVLTGLLPEDKAYHPRELISPSEADKLLNKKKTAEAWNVVKTLYRQAPGKPKVALGSDPAPPYVPSAAASEFDVVEGAE